MTKQEIVSYIRGFTLREDSTQRYHQRFLIAAIEKVIVEMYQDLYKINPRLLSKYTKQYGVTTPITVHSEPISLIDYSNLPVQIVSLPSKASGVLHIYPVVNTGNKFMPMDKTDADLLFNTDVAVVSNRIGYTVRQDSRVDYWNMTQTISSEGVRMDLLIPFSVYADTDVVLIPELSEKEGGTFLVRVLSELGVIPPADLDDSNGVPEQKTKTKA